MPPAAALQQRRHLARAGCRAGAAERSSLGGTHLAADLAQGLAAAFPHYPQSGTSRPVTAAGRCAVRRRMHRLEPAVFRRGSCRRGIGKTRHLAAGRNDRRPGVSERVVSVLCGGSLAYSARASPGILSWPERRYPRAPVPCRGRALGR